MHDVVVINKSWMNRRTQSRCGAARKCTHTQNDPTNTHLHRQRTRQASRIDPPIMASVGSPGSGPALPHPMNRQGTVAHPNEERFGYSYGFAYCARCVGGELYRNATREGSG